MMKSITALLSVGVLALFRSQTVLALPAPQGLGKASALISNYNAAPAPTVPIGGSGNFVTIDKATKLFNLGGKPQYFSGVYIPSSVEDCQFRLTLHRYQHVVARI